MSKTSHLSEWGSFRNNPRIKTQQSEWRRLAPPPASHSFIAPFGTKEGLIEKISACHSVQKMWSRRQQRESNEIVFGPSKDVPVDGDVSLLLNNKRGRFNMSPSLAIWYNLQPEVVQGNI